jgi:enoyl-[acyl-carrier protein] reductase III
MTSFEGASILVTGGSRGIGKAIALRFAALGATRVAIGYFRGDRAAEETAEELRALGAEPTLIRANIASERMVEEVAALGPLNTIVHCAATGVIRPAIETTDKHWDWTFGANARAFLAVVRAAVHEMPPGSSVVALSSLGSMRVLENYAIVGASKAALEALVRYLAVELAPRGIRVNAISAGVVETGALEFFPNRENMLAMGRMAPAGRLVTTEDVATCTTFLCSPDAEMILGQTIVIDGGAGLILVAPPDVASAAPGDDA